MSRYASDRLSSDAFVLWSALKLRGFSLLSLSFDVEWLLMQVLDRDVMHRAIEQLADSGRLRRLRRGVYHVATMPDPSLIELLSAIHVDELRISGPWAINHYLQLPAPSTVDVLRATQARAFTLPARSISDIARPLRVNYVRSSSVRSDGSRAYLATEAQTVIDALEHPGWGVSIKTLRKLLRQMGQWPDNEIPSAANDRRRLAFLVYEECNQQLDFEIGASHATIDLDPAADSIGPISSRWNVRINA